MNLMLGVRGVVGLFYTALIGVVLRQRMKHQPGFGVFLAFLIYLWAANLAQLFLGLAIWGPLREPTRGLVPYYLAFLASVFLFEATLVFIQGRPLRWIWRIVPAVWLAGLILVNENIRGMFLEIFRIGAWFFSLSGVGLGSILAGWGAYSAAAVLVIMVAYRRTGIPLHRNRVLFWLGGTLVMLVGMVLSVLPVFILPVGELVLLAAAALLGYCFFTHDLLDVRYSIRRSATITVSLALSIVIYGLFFFYLLSYLKTSQKSLDGIVVAVGVAAVITLLLHPLTLLIQRLVSKTILESGYDANRVLSSYGKQISNIIELADLAQAITRAIARDFNLIQARLFLIDQRESSIEAVEVAHGKIEAEAIKLDLSRASPVADYLAHTHEPLSQYDIDLLPRFRGIAAGEITGLRHAAIDLYVPIYYQERWIGLLGLGAKRSGDRYYAREISLLETLADQTGVALENARLYADLRLRNTENERLNQELVTANRELANLDQAKSDFINIASHELRTPLTQIIGYNDIIGDMLAKGSIAPGMGEQLMTGARNAARRLEEIVNTMFDVSKLDLSTLELIISPVAPSSLIDAVASRWQDALKDRRIRLVVEDVDTLPAIQADGKRLIQVFTHLVQNAIKFTPDGGEVRVSGKAIQTGPGENERFIEISVADNGIGIAQVEFKRIFDKFYRVGNVLLHSTGEYKFKGAGPGLGLTICRGIVEAHGGRVWVESPGYDEATCPGSIFHVLIPVVAKQPAQPVGPSGLHKSSKLD